jgi:hypothetical protein
MTHDEPDCATERLTPCTAADWELCDRCFRLVCLRHAALYEVCGSGERLYYKVDRLCHWCVSECVEQGELVTGGDAQWVNLR